MTQAEKTWNVLDSGMHTDTGDRVKISELEEVNAAYATSRCLSGTNDFWAAAEYIARMIDKNGKRYDVVYLFEDTDMTDEDREPIEEENYPWDEDHIARVFAVYDSSMSSSNTNHHNNTNGD